jgi:hypothetical protein
MALPLLLFQHIAWVVAGLLGVLRFLRPLVHPRPIDGRLINFRPPGVVSLLHLNLFGHFLS